MALLVAPLSIAVAVYGARDEVGGSA